MTGSTFANVYQLITREWSMSAGARSLSAFAARPDLGAAVQRTFDLAWHEGVVFGIIAYAVSSKMVESFIRSPSNRDLYAKHRTGWKRLAVAYNVLMALYSCATALATAHVLMHLPNGLYSNDSTHLFRFADGRFRELARWFYYSKYAEFFDSYFLILSGKPVGWLHYFHHMFAAADMWVLFARENEGIWIFVQFNSVIHTLMYAYYAVTACELPREHVARRVTDRLKVGVTLLQIVQLTVGNSLGVVYIVLDCVEFDVDRMIGFVFNFVYISTLVAFFVHFAVCTYVLAPKRTSRSRPQSGGNTTCDDSANTALSAGSGSTSTSADCAPAAA